MKRLKPIMLILFIGIFSIHCYPQDTYWVYFKDKTGNKFVPEEYFSEKALERRLRNRVPLSTYEDWPVNSIYTQQVSHSVDSVLAVSRWLNAIVVKASPETIDHIVDFNFVKYVKPLIHVSSVSETVTIEKKQTISHLDSALLHIQTERMQGSAFRESNLDGSGVLIAVFDAGFKKLRTHPAFDHLIENNSILATYDFVKKDTFVYGFHHHGTMVMSCIAGIYGNTYMGLAPGAHFLLARTETPNETTEEEYNWILAAEWADRNGADIISCSLGYSTSNYFQEDMDGQTSPVAKGAQIASNKGILIINAAGNEANNYWKTVVTPADVEEVLTVGGTNPYTDIAFTFSSPGPTADGRLKPNVCALGETLTAYKNRYRKAYGTSFATPLVAGFAACVLQNEPELDRENLMERIEMSGHLYPYFDYHHGYGIPQARKILKDRDGQDAATFKFELSEGYLNVIVEKRFIPKKNEAGELLDYPKNLYYHIQDATGPIRKYGVVLADENEEVVFFNKIELQTGDIIRVHFEGYTEDYIYTPENE